MEQELEQLNTILNLQIQEQAAEIEAQKEKLRESEARLKRVKSELREAKKAAEFANRTKSEFLANMSHEIRTPMNAILGFSEILEDSIQDDQQRHYLSAITRSGKALLRLINDILDLSKIEAGKLEFEYKAFDPRRILHEIEQIFSQKIAEKNLKFIVDIDPLLPEFLVLDETRLRQVLLNLVGNAVKFTESGHVRVSIQSHPSDEADNTVDLGLVIEDTGIGIPEDQQESIFEVFEQRRDQYSSQYGGTGLGLAISKRLVEMMGGMIAVIGEEGQGSTFTVMLRHVTKADAPDVTEREEIPPDAVRFCKATILIADDVALNRKLLSAYLKECDFTFIEAEDGQEAVELAQRYHPDLILMDMKMPHMDGQEATQVLKTSAETRGIPILAVTAATIRGVEKTIGKLCDGYLIKPIDRVELLSALKKFLKYSLEPQRSLEELSPQRSDQNELDVCPKPEMPGQLSELAQILQTSYMSRCEDLREMLIMSYVKPFADELHEIAQKYRFQPLADYSQKLSMLAQRYDVDEVEKTLIEFPELLKHLT